MTEIQDKQNEIEQKINEWRDKGRIIDVSPKKLPNGSTITKRIQHSGQPFTVSFNGQGCKVRFDYSNQPSCKFMWEQEDVVEKVLSYIEQLLDG